MPPPKPDHFFDFSDADCAADQAPRTPTVLEKIQESRNGTGFRPVHRPPMALLCVIDDGREDGEWLRLRGDEFVIGRAEGHLVIGHDGMMSGRHAKISRELSAGRYRWHLADLGSTNGTFVRVAGASLKNGQEFLLGGRRYRFDDAAPGAVNAGVGPAPAGDVSTRGWKTVAPTDLISSFVELKPDGGLGQRYFLDGDEFWAGSSQSLCKIAIGDDVLLSPRHVRFYRDAKGAWLLDNAAAPNGVWLRVQRVGVDASVRFQLGEQRFLLKVL
jgi:hypothetical protein